MVHKWAPVIKTNLSALPPRYALKTLRPLCKRAFGRAPGKVLLGRAILNQDIPASCCVLAWKRGTVRKSTKKILKYLYLRSPNIRLNQLPLGKEKCIVEGISHGFMYRQSYTLEILSKYDDLESISEHAFKTILSKRDLTEIVHDNSIVL